MQLHVNLNDHVHKCCVTANMNYIELYKVIKLKGRQYDSLSSVKSEARCFMLTR